MESLLEFVQTPLGASLATAAGGGLLWVVRWFFRFIKKVDSNTESIEDHVHTCSQLNERILEKIDAHHDTISRRISELKEGQSINSEKLENVTAGLANLRGKMDTIEGTFHALQTQNAQRAVR